MTDFAETRRQRCRECQIKLPSPTSNAHHAFCCKGCHAAFYRQRCAVCETERVRRQLCHRPKCRSAYRGYRPKFAFPGLGSGSVKERARNVDGMGIKSATEARPWIVIAGPQLSERSLHSAALPLDPRYADYLDRLNVEPLKRHFAELGRKAIFQRHTAAAQFARQLQISRSPKGRFTADGKPGGNQTSGNCAADHGRPLNPGPPAENNVTNREFERLDRNERLATLRFVQDRDGLDSPLYCTLGAQHQYLLNRANRPPTQQENT